MSGIDEVGLGQALQKARLVGAMTQQELCQRAGLSYSTLAKIERGAIKAPSIFTIQSIADALGLSLDDLMSTVSPSTAKPPKKTSQSGVSFVYFDINGCLVRFFHRAFKEIAKASDKRTDQVENIFWHYNDVACRGEMPMEEFNKTLGEMFGIAGFEWRKYYLAAVDPIEEMHELITWASSNYDIGLLSNIMPGLIHEMLVSGILPDLPYAAIIDSSEVKAIKPETAIYEIAQVKAGRPVNQLLLIDDSRSNLIAAEKLGWHVLWFDDYRPDESVDKIRAALEPAKT